MSFTSNEQYCSKKIKLWELKSLSRDLPLTARLSWGQLLCNLFSPMGRLVGITVPLSIRFSVAVSASSIGLYLRVDLTWFILQGNQTLPLIHARSHLIEPSHQTNLQTFNWNQQKEIQTNRNKTNNQIKVRISFHDFYNSKWFLWHW